MYCFSTGVPQTKKAEKRCGIVICWSNSIELLFPVLVWQEVFDNGDKILPDTIVEVWKDWADGWRNYVFKVRNIKIVFRDVKGTAVVKHVLVIQRFALSPLTFKFQWKSAICPHIHSGNQCRISNHSGCSVVLERHQIRVRLDQVLPRWTVGLWR